MSAGISSRPASWVDVPAIVDLFLRWDVAVMGHPDTDEGDVREVWEQPGFSPGTDTTVLEDGDSLVGYAEFLASGHVGVWVDPSHAGDVLEDRLLAWALERAQRDTPIDLESWVVPGQPGEGEALLRHGFAHTSTMWRMGIELADEPPEPAWPEGIALRPFVADQDSRAVHRVVQEAFRDIPHSHERTYDEWAPALVGRPGVDLSLFFVAADSRLQPPDDIAGVALTFDFGETGGYVRQLAVPRAHRGRGIGLALLRTAFAEHRRRGFARSSLGVDGENDAALVLYRKAGMQVVREFHRYTRRLG